jgi:hypothetical protein
MNLSLIKMNYVAKSCSSKIIRLEYRDEIELLMSIDMSLLTTGSDPVVTNDTECDECDWIVREA